MKKSKPSVLFIVNGLGLGNSTRCYAIIEELAKNNLNLYAVTSGNSTVFLKSCPNLKKIFPIEQLTYSFSKKGRLRPIKTFLSLPRSLKQVFHNRKRIQSIVRETNPSIIVLDSHYLLPYRYNNIAKLYAINNSKDVVREFFKRPLWPLNLLFHFFAFEFADFLYHKFLIGNVFSPKIPSPSSKGKHQSLLVRSELQSKTPVSISRILVMLSGSSSGESLISPTRWQTNLQIDVLGIDGVDSENVKFHGKVHNNLSFLNNADLLVINAGFSALSEAIALRKPTIVVPIPGHAEQYANARRFQKLGVGLVSNPDQLEQTLNKMIHNPTPYTSACKKLDFDTKSAEYFSQEILSLLKKS